MTARKTTLQIVSVDETKGRIEVEVDGDGDHRIVFDIPHDLADTPLAGEALKRALVQRLHPTIRDKRVRAASDYAAHKALEGAVWDVSEIYDEIADLLETELAEARAEAPMAVPDEIVR